VPLGILNNRRKIYHKGQGPFKSTGKDGGDIFQAFGLPICGYGGVCLSLQPWDVGHYP